MATIEQDEAQAREIKTDAAGGQMTVEARYQVNQKNAGIETRVKEEREAKTRDAKARMDAQKSAPEKPTTPQAATTTSTETKTKPEAKTETKTTPSPFEEAQAAEIRRTQALLALFDSDVQIDGKPGGPVITALDRFAERAKKADPSLRFNSYEEIAEQLRVEARARFTDSDVQALNASSDPRNKEVGKELGLFLSDKTPSPSDRRAVLPPGVTRTVETTTAPAAASQQDTSTPEQRIERISYALSHMPEKDTITNSTTGKFLTEAYQRHLDNKTVTAGEPVLFAGSRSGQLFVAYSDPEGKNTVVKDVTKFYNPTLKENPLARDIALLAQAKRGGLADNDTIPAAEMNAQAQIQRLQELRAQERQGNLPQNGREVVQYSSNPDVAPAWWRRGPDGSYPPPIGYRGHEAGHIGFRGDHNYPPPPGYYGHRNEHHGHDYGHNRNGRSFEIGIPGLGGIFNALGLNQGTGTPGVENNGPSLGFGMREDHHGRRSFDFTLN